VSQNKRYWDTTITGHEIIPSRTSILETLNKIVTSPPKIPPKFTISRFEKVIFDIRMTASEHPFLTAAVVIVALLFALWSRVRTRRLKGGYFRLDEKDGLLGRSSNGKVD
jgi:protein disulfide-isomerase